MVQVCSASTTQGPTQMGGWVLPRSRATAGQAWQCGVSTSHGAQADSGEAGKNPRLQDPGTKPRIQPSDAPWWLLLGYPFIQVRNLSPSQLSGELPGTGTEP